jgi:pyridoxal phosphate enzyme (YggS family)
VDLLGNLTTVRECIAGALRTAGRPAGSVRLVAVTKTQPAAVVAAAIAAGLRDLGENRIEEAVDKMAAIPKGEARWHMIGHIQSRKAKTVAAANLALVHSVDSLPLAERLSRAAQALGRRQPVLLECNVSGEASKAGFRVETDAALEARLSELEQVTALPGLEVRGLMTMAPIVPHAEAARPYFARLRLLGERLRAAIPGAAWGELSMGMTDDFEVAILEGATLVRIGRAIFGERP